MMRNVLMVVVALMLVPAVSQGATEGPHQYLKKKDDWFRSEEGRRVTANILSHQSPAGSWPKNEDTTATLYTGDPAALHGTFDNDATTDELRFLAKAFNATKDERCKAAFEKGLDHIFKAQYPSGGWPQFYPPSTKYHKYITFNDNAMVRLMLFLREVTKDEMYTFVDDGRRKAAKESFDRGIVCVLKCQIKVDGKLTGWCQQHDEVDYSPRPGRAFELVSITGSESVGIVRLLMSLDDPSPEIVASIQGAVAWFEAAKLTGIRVETVPDQTAPKGTNRVVVKDPSAPPIWARFYEIGTNRPIFCDRDGVAKHDLSEIGSERRNGYNWLNYWPADLLSKEYPAWKKKWAGPDSGLEGGGFCEGRDSERSERSGSMVSRTDDASAGGEEGPGDKDGVSEG